MIINFVNLAKFIMYPGTIIAIYLIIKRVTRW